MCFIQIQILLFAKFYNKDSVSKSGKHTNISNDITDIHQLA